MISVNCTFYEMNTIKTYEYIFGLHFVLKNHVAIKRDHLL